MLWKTLQPSSASSSASARSTALVVATPFFPASSLNPHHFFSDQFSVSSFFIGSTIYLSAAPMLNHLFVIAVALKADALAGLSGRGKVWILLATLLRLTVRRRTPRHIRSTFPIPTSRSRASAREHRSGIPPVNLIQNAFLGIFERPTHRNIPSFHYECTRASSADDRPCRRTPSTPTKET